MNEYTSQAVTYGSVFAKLMVSALKTVPGAALLATGKLRLSSDPAFGATPNSPLSYFTANEAAFSGYPTGGIAVSLTTGLNISDQIVGALTSGLFEAATATPFVPGQVYGYWIDDGTEFAIAEKFADGGIASFAAIGDFLVLNAILPFDLNQAAA